MYDEIRQFRAACGEAHMKSILAIGELGTYTNVYKASLVAMMAGESDTVGVWWRFFHCVQPYLFTIMIYIYFNMFQFLDLSKLYLYVDD